MNSTLTEYGLDSIAVVELAQACEREFDVFLTVQDLKTMTISKLYNLHLSKIQGTSKVSIILVSRVLLRQLDYGT